MKIAVLALLISFNVFAQVETIEFSPSADTFVTSNNQAQTNGSNTILDVGNYHAANRVLMKFDETELKNALSDKDIVSARLELPISLHYISSDCVIGLHQMTKAWNAETATWNFPIDSSEAWLLWSHNPNNEIPYPYNTNPFATDTIVKDQVTPLGFDIKNYVVDLMSAENNYGFTVYKNTTDVGSPLQLFSSEGSQKPKLIVQYKELGPETLDAKLNASVSEGQIPLALSFDASSTFVPQDKSISKYELDLGNGTTVTLDKNNPQYEFSYETEGEYAAVLTVTDSEGNTSTNAVIIVAYSNDSESLDKNYSYQITPDSDMNIKHDSGDTAVFSGEICKVWKSYHLKDNRHCHWIDQKKFVLRAFFPDMTNEVSSELSVTKDQHKRNFTYTASNLEKDNANTLILMLGEDDGRSITLGSLEAKIKVRIDIIDEKIQELTQNGGDPSMIAGYVELRDTLKGICRKIELRNAKAPTILAQYNIPLNVEDKVSSPRYYSTISNGIRYELTSPIGNLIEGDKAKIQTRVTNIAYESKPWNKVETYRFDYLYKGTEVNTLTEASFSKNASHEFTFESTDGGSLDDIHSFSVRLFEKYKWWERLLGYSDIELPISEDTETPIWKNQVSEITYAKNFPKITLKAKDAFGRINPDSLNVSISGVSNEDITSKFDVEALNRGNEYIFEANIALDFAQEGSYTISSIVSDYAGNQSELYTREFFIDRTKPTLATDQSDNVLTNNPSFMFDISVTDDSPVSTKVLLNDIHVETYEGESFTVSLTLGEGTNKISIISEDAAGNVSEVLGFNSIVLDTIAPELLATSPKNGDVLRTLNFPLNGHANEALSEVIIDGAIEGTLLGAGDTFTANISKIDQGSQNISISMTDLAGNSASYSINFEIFLKLIRTELIAVESASEPGKVNIIGAPGSVIGGVDLEIEGGFFNQETVQVEEDGSFFATVDYFSTATLEAYYAPLNKEEKETISSNISNALTGIVKDAISDIPLKGVKVHLQENGAMAYTDEMGIFSIANPGSGNGTLIVDGTTIPVLEAELNDNGLPIRRYSTQVVKVFLNTNTANIIDKPIYFTPLLNDGSETVIPAGQAVTVTSIHAPGVQLEIPADAAVFPQGQNGETIEPKINVMKLDSERTTYNPPESINPDFVYSFEPSGLQFEERVKLTLPNENEFVVGQKLAIMSKNSSTGNWEIDGLATVTAPDKIETDTDSGITHFSDIYAVPYSPDISTFNPSKDKPQLTTGGNSVTTSITLPSFKKYGQDIAPSLIYKSGWANPRALVSQVFNIEAGQYEHVERINETKKASAFAKVQTKGTYRYWTEPDYIKTTFYVDNKESNELTFNIKDAPNNAVISYSMNLDSVSSGLYNARSEYVIRYKHFEQLVAKVYEISEISKKKKKVETLDEGPKELTDIEGDGIITPSPLEDLIVQQNYIDSSFGRGWKLGLTQRVFQPKDDRIMIEEADGSVTPYVIDNTVENLHYDEDGIQAINTENFPNITYTTFTGSIKSLDLESGSSTPTEIVVPKHNIGIAQNYAWRHSRRREKYDCFNGCKSKYKFRYNCVRRRSNYDLTKRLNSIFENSSGFFYLDERGGLYKNNGNESFLAGRLITPGTYNVYQTNMPDPKNHCNQFTLEDQGCVSNSPNYVWVTGETGWTGSSNRQPRESDCNSNPKQNSSGTVPNRGHDSSTVATSSSFNQPRAMIPSQNEAGVFFVADTLNNRIKKINTVTNTVSVIAGNGNSNDNDSAYHGDGRTATSTPIHRPNGLVQDSDGNLYISSDRGYIRMLTPDGKLYFIAGKNRGSTAEISSDLDSLYLNIPRGLALDEVNNFLYVADHFNNRIVQIDLDLGRAIQIAGRGPGSCSATQESGKPALDTPICTPRYISLDNNQNLVIVDEKAKLIRRVNLQLPDAGAARFSPVAKDGSKVIRYNDGSLERVYRNGSSTIFSKDGLHLRSVDRIGKETNFSYFNGLLSSVDFHDGTSMLLNYSGDLLSSIVDPAGRETYFNFNGSKLSSVSFPDGTSKSFDYRVDDGAMIQETNQRGYSTQYEYNKFDFLAKVIQPDGSVEQLSFGISDTVGNDFVEGEVPEIQNQTMESGESDLADSYQNANSVETDVYNDMSGYAEKIIENVDGEQRITRIERDSSGRPVRIEKPNGGIATFVYSNDPSINLPDCNSLTGDLNNQACVSENIIDLISSTDSETGVENYFEYNRYGDVLYSEKRNGSFVIATVRNTYDNYGNLIHAQDSNGNIVSRVYFEETGLLKDSISYVGSNELKTSFVYNDNGNLTQKIAPNGELTDYARDDAGNIESKFNANSVETLYSYDSFNRLLSVTTGVNSVDPVGKSTNYFYNEMGGLTKIVDPKSNETHFEYDKRDRLSKKTTSLGQITELAYDGVGNIVWEKDPNGAEKTFQYNDKNQLIRKELPDNLYQMSYDFDGNMVSISDDAFPSLLTL